MLSQLRKPNVSIERRANGFLNQRQASFGVAAWPMRIAHISGPEGVRTEAVYRRLATNRWNDAGMSRFDEGYYGDPSDMSYWHWCRNCLQTGHERRDCDQPPRCYTCGMVGHLQFQCEYTQCTAGNCHKFGHMADRCQLPITCYRCNAANHFARDCHAILDPVEEARQAFEEGDIAKAISWYTEAIEKYRPESIFYAGRAKAYMLMDEYDYVREDLEYMIELVQGRVSDRAYMDLAWCNGTLGDMSDALNIIDEKVLAKNPENPVALDLRAKVLALERRHHNIGLDRPMRRDQSSGNLLPARKRIL
ncbi:hypothetical protein EVG20_g4310 [Dentipellis fragilis]|uniref:CCHC-type domain-containing protein n=1 Tax=Dentipellis fragilis TaxID=205917 RepID=A0A4Y9YYN3_9AGAM|nr:hypothetical protein EVG20_g4310 [Dentipellis fragilis]